MDWDTTATQEVTITIADSEVDTTMDTTTDTTTTMDTAMATTAFTTPELLIPMEESVTLLAVDIIKVVFH